MPRVGKAFCGPGVCLATAPVLVEDRESLRPFLSADPVGSAVVWDRVFQQPNYHEVYVDAMPPKAVLALSRSKSGAGPARVAVHAADAGAADRVLEALPRGPLSFHVTGEALAEALRPRCEAFRGRPAWLFSLEPADFRDLQAHAVLPVDPAWAPTIARLWEPDWPSEAYVRGRIENGPTAGVYVGGELVAWAMTHFVTDRVAMLGFFHVLEAHRRKGYGKSAACALTKQVLRDGRVPALFVNADNAPSLQLVETIGFRRRARHVWGEAVVL